MIDSRLYWKFSSQLLFSPTRSWTTLPKGGAHNKVVKCRGGDSYVSCEVFTISCCGLATAHGTAQVT